MEGGQLLFMGLLWIWEAQCLGTGNSGAPGVAPPLSLRRLGDCPTQRVSLPVIVPPEGTLACVETFLAVVPAAGGGAIARNVTKHPTTLRTVARSKDSKCQVCGGRGILLLPLRPSLRAQAKQQPRLKLGGWGRLGRASTWFSPSTPPVGL